MGYIIAAILFLVVVIPVILSIRSGRSSAAKGPKKLGHTIGVTTPAADEPTPGASDTNDPTTVQNAQHRVPPA